jgi:hypothetical protein
MACKIRRKDCAVFATRAQRFVARSRHLLETNHFSVLLVVAVPMRRHFGLCETGDG